MYLSRPRAWRVLAGKAHKLNNEDDTVDFFLTVEECRAMVIELRRVEAIGVVNYGLAPSAEQNAKGKRSLYVSAPINRRTVY